MIVDLPVMSPMNYWLTDCSPQIELLTQRKTVEKWSIDYSCRMTFPTQNGWIDVRCRSNMQLDESTNHSMMSMRVWNRVRWKLDGTTGTTWLVISCNCLTCDKQHETVIWINFTADHLSVAVLDDWMQFRSIQSRPRAPKWTSFWACVSMNYCFLSIDFC